MSASTYLTAGRGTTPGKRSLGKIFLSTFVALVFTALALSSALVGHSQTVHAQDEDSFDVVRWAMCLFGDDSMPAMIYQVAQTSDVQFALQSKSVISPGVEDVEMGPLAMNWMLDITGGKYKTTNETILGHALDPESKEATTKKGTYNSGEKVNPFDRFGVAGLTWTAYAGEWKYIVVKACHPGEMNDPKAGLFYEGRLVPQSVWEDRDNSLDVRTQQHAAGLGTSLMASFTNLIANFIFDIAKFIVVLTLSLINFAFSDLVHIMGLDEWLAGDSDSTGMFGKLFQGIFEPFVFVAFTLTGLSIMYQGLVKRQFRGALNMLFRSLALFFIAIIIAAKPAFFIALPNTVSVSIQAAMVSAMNQGLAGGDGLCATDVGSTSTKLIENTSEAEASILEQASANMRSSIGCSFWQQFLLKPWAEGQYGKDWNQLWAKDKIPSWAPEGATGLANTEGNATMVGNAEVPLGGKSVLNNWAVYQISTQTNAHSTTGSPDKFSKYTSGVANDWWRIVDVLANYEEETKTANVGKFGEETDTNPNENPGSSTGEKTWPTPNKVPLSGNYNGHSGIDIPVATGTPAIAVMDGVVTRLRQNDGASYGNAIFVKFSDGTEAVYAHLSAFKVAANDTFSAGQTIGLTGSTGRSTGPHLHFEIKPGDSVWGNASNRPATIDYLNGTTTAPPNTPNDGGTNNGKTVTYSVPKNNPRLDMWDQWVGNNIFNRLGTATSAVFVALIGVIAPLFFAFLTAVYALGVGLLMAFAPLMLLLGCWAGPGWEMFKSWGQLVVQTVFKRIAAGVMLVLSITFSAAAIKIMETESWWEGIMLMVLLSVILIRSRHKILDAFASVRFASNDFSGNASRISGAMFGTAKSAGTLAFAGAVGAHSASKAGGGAGAAFTGATAGLKTEFRNMGYRNSVVRNALRTYDSSLQMRGKAPSDSSLAQKFQYCMKCETKIDDYDYAYLDDVGNVYCAECGDSADPESSLRMVNIKEYENVPRTEVKPVYVETAYKGFKQDKFDMASDSERPKLDEAGFRTAVADAAAQDIHRYRTMKQQGLPVEPPQPPDYLVPYLDIPLLKAAWEKDQWDYIRNVYAIAWAQWATETFEEEFTGLVEQLLQDIDFQETQLLQEEGTDGIPR